jgi:hypothetical protein
MEAVIRVCSPPLQSAIAEFQNSGTKAESHFGAQSVIKSAWATGSERRRLVDSAFSPTMADRDAPYHSLRPLPWLGIPI